MKEQNSRIDFKSGNRSKADTDIKSLVQRAQSGDQRALGLLLDEARPRVMAVAMKVLRNPSDAEDATQDALAKIWRYLPRFECRSSFFTWTHRIVTNTSLDLLRKVKLRHETTEESGGGAEESRERPEASHHETPELLMSREQERSRVHQAMDALTPPHREVLHLREFEEESYDAIAQRVACPIGTVMSRLHHARARLGKELSTMVQSEQALALAA